MLSGRELVNALSRAGWNRVRTTGSHIILVKPGCFFTVSIPNHKEIDRGTLKGILRVSGISAEELVLLLRK